MKIYTSVKRIEFNEKVDIPFQYLLVIIVSFVGVIIISSIYKSGFIKNTQPKLKALRAKMRDVKSYIYRNLSNDSRFLSALKTNDSEGVVDAMKRNVKNQVVLTKMMFTYNLYLYFIANIPESDPAFDQINAMFSTDGIRTQKVDPSMLFYYKKTEFVPNQYYLALRNQLEPELKTSSMSFIKAITTVMKELNKKLMQIQNINEGKVAVRDYMWKILWSSVAVTLVLIIMLLFILYKDLLFKLVGWMFTKKK